MVCTLPSQNKALRLTEQQQRHEIRLKDILECASPSLQHLPRHDDHAVRVDRPIADHERQIAERLAVHELDQARHLVGDRI